MPFTQRTVPRSSVRGRVVESPTEMVREMLTGVGPGFAGGGVGSAGGGVGSGVGSAGGGVGSGVGSAGGGVGSGVGSAGGGVGSAGTVTVRRYGFTSLYPAYGFTRATYLPAGNVTWT